MTCENSLACNTVLCIRATNNTRLLIIYSFKYCPCRRQGQSSRSEDCSPYLTSGYNPYPLISTFFQTPLLVLLLVLGKLHWFWILGTFLMSSFNRGLLLYFGSIASEKLNENFSPYKLSIDSSSSSDGLPYLLTLTLWLLDVALLPFIWITRIKSWEIMVFSIT
jgi:hypothetical protein